jgi:hypothetical protein
MQERREEDGSTDRRARVASIREKGRRRQRLPTRARQPGKRKERRGRRKVWACSADWASRPNRREEGRE